MNQQHEQGHRTEGNKAAHTDMIRPLTPTVDKLLEKATRFRATTPEEQTRLAEDEARRQRAKLVMMLAHDLGPRYEPRRAALDSFEHYHAAQAAVVERLRALDVPGIVTSGAGLIFYGPVGTGKDHLLAAMLYEAAGKHGLPGKWINGQEWFGALRDRIGENRPEEEILRQLSDPLVLAISDPIPAARSPSPWNVEMLYRLIDRRYRHLKSTWMTLNASTPEEADEKLSAPVFDRLREGAHFFKCFWPSYRERKRL